MSLSSLELKVHPPLVAIITALIMWGISLVTPVYPVSDTNRISAAIVVALIGGGVSLAGIISFRRVKTTINPVKPERASSLVVVGVYKITRNPMYVGIMLVLIAWALFLSSHWALPGSLLFVLYISKFQIVPD